MSSQRISTDDRVVHIPVKPTNFGGSLLIFLPSYRQPTDLPQSTDFYLFFADLPNYNFFYRYHVDRLPIPR